jgi:hypothetical protein
MLVLAAAALIAEACSSSNGTKGTGGADGGSSTGGATGTGGKGMGGGTAGMTGTGGKVDSGTDTAGTGGVTGTGGKIDSGTDTVTGTGGKIDSGIDLAVDTPVIPDASVDVVDPAAPEKALCLTPPFMANITATPFTAAQFCALYFSLCDGRVGATDFANETDCEAAYNGYNMTPDADMSPSGQKGCRSYHLCNAYNGGNPTTASLNTHCPHSTGFLPNDGGPGGPCP